MAVNEHEGQARRLLAQTLLVALACGLPAGCVSARTEVVISVDTDIATLDTITLDVTDPAGATRSSVAALGASEPPLPRTLGLAWNGGALGPFVVRAAGTSGGAQQIVRIADFTFQRGRTLVLHVDLLARCTGVSCPGGQTCGDSGCRPITTDPSELTPYTPAASDGGVGGDGGGCGVEVCNGMDDDCDGQVDEDFDFASDIANCGTCGNVCDFTHAMGMCQAGRCQINGCDPGFGDCNGRTSDGCESDSATDTSNCGRCGTRCRGGSSMCCSGTCAGAC